MPRARPTEGVPEAPLEQPPAARPAAVARQARGEERRREVLEAALRVIGTSGIRAATHRAVAAEAGTSLSATTYYFASGEDLLEQAFAHYVDERTGHLAAVLEAAGSAGRLDAAVGEDLLTTFVLDELTTGRLRIAAEFRLALEGSTNPRMAEQFERLGRSVEALLTTLLTLAASPDPALDARVMLSFVRGLELDEVTREQPSSPAEVALLCRRFARALMASPSP
jgi:DNA-binding transcriptional regulator YbjK